MKLISCVLLTLALSACATAPPCNVSVKDDTAKVHLNLQPLPPLDLTSYKSLNLVTVQNGQQTVVQMNQDDYTKLDALINTLGGRIEALQDEVHSYQDFYEKP